MKHFLPSLGLVVAASITFARALWTREINFLAGKRTPALVRRSASWPNATAAVHRRTSRSRSVTNRSFRFLALLALAGTILFAPTLPQALAQDINGTPPPPGDGDFNATGITGIFNGNVTTGCSYDPLTGNAKRVVTDLVVPGSVGKYPSKWCAITTHVTVTSA